MEGRALEGSMNKRHRELRDRLRDMADSFGAMVEFDKTSPHHRAIFRRGDRSKFVVFSGTKASFRAQRNLISMARKILREISA
jgi:hypothetical protein